MGQTSHHGPSCQIAPSADLLAKLMGCHHSRDQAIGLPLITTERHSRGRYARYPSKLRSGQLLSPNRQYKHSSLRHTSPQYKYKFACNKDTSVYRVGQHYSNPRTRSVVHHTKNPGATPRGAVASYDSFDARYRQAFYPRATSVLSDLRERQLERHSKTGRRTNGRGKVADA